MTLPYGLLRMLRNRNEPVRFHLLSNAGSLILIRELLESSLRELGLHPQTICFPLVDRQAPACRLQESTAAREMAHAVRRQRRRQSRAQRTSAVAPAQTYRAIRSLSRARITSSPSPRGCAVASRLRGALWAHRAPPGETSHRDRSASRGRRCRGPLPGFESRRVAISATTARRKYAHTCIASGS